MGLYHGLSLCGTVREVISKDCCRVMYTALTSEDMNLLWIDSVGAPTVRLILVSHSILAKAAVLKRTTNVNGILINQSRRILMIEEAARHSLYIYSRAKVD